MKKIGIIEINTKNHSLSGIARISNSKNNTVTIFTTPDIFSHLEDELGPDIKKYTVVLKKDKENITAFLKRVEHICNTSIDFLWVHTLGYWQFLFFKPSCKKIFMARNLRFWFKSTASIKDYLDMILNRLQSTINPNLLRNALIGPILRKHILKYYDGIVVEYPPMIEYLTSHSFYTKPLFFFPHEPYENTKKKHSDEIIQFVIPGRIKTDARDYNLILNVFTELFKSYKKSIALYLLGKPYGASGQRIIQRCEQLKKQGYPMYYYTEFISNDEFEQVMKSSDILLSPIKLEYLNETYSWTKGTGTFTNSTKYGLPTIVPQGYVIAQDIQTSHISYHDETDLKKQLQEIISHKKKLKELKKAATSNAQLYELTVLQQQFNEMIKNLEKINKLND